MTSFNATPSAPPAGDPATSPRRTLRIVDPDLAEALTVDQRAFELLEAGNGLAVECWSFGYRAGVAAERARVQLVAANFRDYLGPEPRLPDYYTQTNGARR